MGSTGEPDRKRKHISSISLSTATPKKPSFFPSTEDKKLDATVLQYQNQKLVQKLEVQKAERSDLEIKLCQLRERHKPYETSLEVVNKSWETLVDGLNSCSICTRDLESSACDNVKASSENEPTSSQMRDCFLSRLSETGATESCSATPDEIENDRQACGAKVVICKLVGAINDVWHLLDQIHAFVLKALPEDGSCRQKASCDLKLDLKNLRLALDELHLKHRSLAGEIQDFRDADAKNKAMLRRLRGELEGSAVELEESNSKLATLKSEKDESNGRRFPVLSLGSRHTTADKASDKQKDLQDMESALKDLLEQASSRLVELTRLHEERIRLLSQLSDLQITVKNVKCVSSSQSFLTVRDQLAKSKAELVQFQVLFEKLQVEKDTLAWREKKSDVQDDLIEVFGRSLTTANVRITELEKEVQKQLDERDLFDAKLKLASKESGRKDIIAEFKALVSSFPGNMGAMQGQLSKFKDAAVDVHALRSDVQSHSSILDRTVKDTEALCSRFTEQAAEVLKLQTTLQDLKQNELELKLMMEMFMRESMNSREVVEARCSEYRTWAHAQSLRSSLDEHRLELRVKKANEAEARSQQRLAAAEAEIADLRQNFEASKRDLPRLSDVLKSKHEENEAYLSEIETIGQAYDDMQNQNQHLLQQIMERDEYNLKLYLEGLRARQLQDALLVEKVTLEKELRRASASQVVFDMAAAKVEDKLKICAELIQKLAEETEQNSSSLQNTHKKSLDVRKSSQQARESLEESQVKVEKSRVRCTDIRIELEKERFMKKRMEEELEIAKGKASRLRAQMDGSSVVGKLHRELKEYKEILKCSICLDRPKEVVITKCYHLFCYSCVQRIMETRHRKCPVCASSFGPNDVKPVYI